MKCSQCENSATVHLTEIIDGKTKKIDLCESCAKEKGVTDPAGFALADLLLGLGASSQIETSGDGKQLVCGACGFTQGDFKKTGRLGCPECYSTFAEPLEAMLKQMHKDTLHRGKVPAHLKEQRERGLMRADLQTKLEESIKAENYELAAQIRDQLKQFGTATFSRLEE
ncbi:MAG: excinuclease ABC subunit B [Pedosphaera sp.]|nr:excinuclease ABC subunit B [Pedosphaera sp.]